MMSLIVVTWFHSTISSFMEWIQGREEGRGMFHESLGQERGIGFKTCNISLSLFQIIKQLYTHTTHHPHVHTQTHRLKVYAKI